MILLESERTKVGVEQNDDGPVFVIHNEVESINLNIGADGGVGKGRRTYWVSGDVIREKASIAEVNKIFLQQLDYRFSQEVTKKFRKFHATI